MSVTVSRMIIIVIVRSIYNHVRFVVNSTSFQPLTGLDFNGMTIKMTINAERGEEHFQEYFHKHFPCEGHNGFNCDVEIIL